MGVLVNVLRNLTLGGDGGEPARPDLPAADLYIDLLKRCVSNAIYDDDLDLMQGTKTLDPATGKYVVLDPQKPDESSKHYGRVWPSRAHTMIGVPRLDNVRYCIETALAEGIPGDLIETGVWRGGASIFMRGILKARGVVDRTVWVADSFEGLPPADLAKYPKESTMPLHLAGDLRVSIEQVRENFARYGLLDEQVQFLKGWFRDTLPTAPIGALAVMRLDGDLYESTMDALVALWPKLSPGGFVIVDDYNALQCCNDAVEDFRRQHGIVVAIQPIPGSGAYWRK